MKYFFSVDWGTTSLRVRFISIKNDSIVIVNEITDHTGCAYVHELFIKEKTATTSREDFFLSFLLPHLVIPESIKAVQRIPVVISGMATSSVGIREIPYSSLPFALSGDNLRYEIIPETKQFPYKTLLLSGVCDSVDVMRGEEIQLLGLRKNYNQETEALFILPGTHSKHILVKDNNVVSFKTYITGEMFQLLSTQSLLKNSVTKTSSINEEAFRMGVRLSKGNLLNNIFGIRANSLLHNSENTWNYSLLSGLLIGNELREITSVNISTYLCAHGNLSQSYAVAIQELSMQHRCTIIPPNQVDESVVYGQKTMAERYWNILENL